MIVEVDRFGHYLCVENVGVKVEDLIGWSIQCARRDSVEIVLYRFPSNCFLPGRMLVKILSHRASESISSWEKCSCLIASSISNWIVSSPHFYLLFDPQGKERHRFIRE